LLEVAGATDLSRFLSSLSEHGEEDSRQNRYDGDNDEQFDQGKRVSYFH
jgi:hypothetical protein